MLKNEISYGKLLEGIQKVIQRGDYENFLKIIKKIKRKYSFLNTLLIYSQNPNATILKGFCEWNKLGRGIKKNPKTVYIYVPIKYKKEKIIEGQQNIEGKENKQRKESNIEIIEGIRYKKVAVYDISDTYLKKGEKRIPFIDDSIDSDTTEDLYNILVKISPVPIVFENNLGVKKGYYDKKKIVLNNNLSKDGKTAVLIHELCHCLYDDFSYKIDRDKSEVFVESVAFLVADYFNFNTSICSFGYITNWARSDIENFLKISNKIKETADKYIELIKNSKYEQEKISA